MKIKKLVFFVVIIVLLIILGVFLWKSNKAPDIGLVRFEEFEIEQTPEGKIIRHQDTGLEVTIPTDWRVVDGKDKVYLDSPNFELNKDSGIYATPIPQKGCNFNVNIEEESDSNYEYIKDRLEFCLEAPDECGYKVIKINENNAIEHISHTDNEKLLGNHVRIQVPKNNNIYVFEAYLFGEDKEKCEEEFNKILETVKIK